MRSVHPGSASGGAGKLPIATGCSWPMAAASVIELIATLPTNNLLSAMTGLEQADRKAV